uniref:Odorant-binding protein 30 n=1 Tax=Chouioia cunea TaxID=1570515 RepID=A0A6B9CPU6_9HYME|nr:odorant-binding protein 30 [Chouioia cunea]
MKIYVCVAGVLSALVLVQCEIASELKSQLDECLKEFELSEESLKSPNFEDPKVQCFAACVMKKGDRLVEGKVSIDKEVELVPMYTPKKIDDALKEQFTECVNKANEEKDECAVAGSLYKCLFEKYGALAS